MSRRYEYDMSKYRGSSGETSGFLDMEDPMTSKVVAGAVGIAAGAALMHFAMKYNWMGLGHPAAAAPATAPAQVPATTTPATTTPASSGVQMGVYR